MRRALRALLTREVDTYTQWVPPVFLSATLATALTCYFIHRNSASRNDTDTLPSLVDHPPHSRGLDDHPLAGQHHHCLTARFPHPQRNRRIRTCDPNTVIAVIRVGSQHRLSDSCKPPVKHRSGRALTYWHLSDGPTCWAQEHRSLVTTAIHIAAMILMLAR
jgi:hypothetical protein